MNYKKTVKRQVENHRKKPTLEQRKNRTSLSGVKRRPIVIKKTVALTTPDKSIPLELKLSLTRENLARLWLFLLQYPNHCADLFFDLINPVIDRVAKTIERKDRIVEIKMQASRLHALFSELCKMSLEKCPIYFKNLVEHVKKSEYKTFVLNSRGKLMPKALTYYCMEKIQEMAGWPPLSYYGMTPFTDTENFYITYILPDLKKVKEELKRDGIENLEEKDENWLVLIVFLTRLTEGNKSKD